MRAMIAKILLAVTLTIPTAMQPAFAEKPAMATISMQHYNPYDGLQQTSFSEAPSLGSPYSANNLFSDMVKEFQKKMGAAGKATELVSERADPAEADFRFILNHVYFIDNKKPAFDLLATLPPNKQAASAKVRELSSPWLRATMYRTQENELVGGDILFIWSSDVRLAELFFMAKGDWERAMSRPTTKEKHFLLEYWGSHKNDIRKATKVNYDFAGINDISSSCISMSYPFYIKVYEFLITAALGLSDSPKMNNNKYYNFVPDEKSLDKLAESAGDYNCFIKRQRMGNQ